MVCKKCEKKLSKLAAPDPFSATSSREGKRKIGENLLLRSRGAGVGSSAGPSTGIGPKSTGPSKGRRFQPYAAKKCKDCGSNVSQNGASYCHGCAYKKGICSICGKAVLDTTPYTMSAK
ncbi:hypothetical protein FS842_000094 [Serendipita sp. 407]|nr:hypothetical protein FRC18_006578 [Serendipita sp. 400]KAG9058896.1 hypothetical protein FS842_000094 [Serendipita sp. 407]